MPTSKPMPKAAIAIASGATTGFLVLAALCFGLVRHQTTIAAALFAVAIVDSLMILFILRQPPSPPSRAGARSA